MLPAPSMTEADRKDRFQLVVVGLASLLVMSLVALLVMALLWQTGSGGSKDGDRAIALAAAGKAADKAARAAVVEMTTYSYTSIDKDFRWVDDAGTAHFRKQYAEVSKPIKELVVRLKARAKGTVVASAPKVTDVDHVTVLLFVDQLITNPGTGTSGAQRGLDQPRVTMSMVRQDGRWLVDEVKLSGLNS
jgi:Mce-associated membrane protein